MLREFKLRIKYFQCQSFYTWLQSKGMQLAEHTRAAGCLLALQQALAYGRFHNYGIIQKWLFS
jgi:hypothetical protein